MSKSPEIASAPLAPSYKSVSATLYPVESLIPFTACCCMVTSCYLGRCQGCDCSKKEGTTGRAPSIAVTCCSCGSCPCYALKCCQCETDCFKIQVRSNISESLYQHLTSFVTIDPTRLLVCWVLFLLLSWSSMRLSSRGGSPFLGDLLLRDLLLQRKVHLQRLPHFQRFGLLRSGRPERCEGRDEVRL